MIKNAHYVLHQRGIGKNYNQKVETLVVKKFLSLKCSEVEAKVAANWNFLEIELTF